MSKRNKDLEHALTRRNMIKYSLTAGAFLGLPRWKVFEILESSHGTAMAADASCSPTNRSVHLVAGSGGFAWFQLLWPHNAIASAGDDTFAFHAPGQQVMAANTDRPLTLGPQAPWKDLPGAKQVTAMMAGNNQAHTRSPLSAVSVGNISALAAAAALQATNPSLVPVIRVDDRIAVGNAPGAPAVATVNNANGIVSLFGSAASEVGGALENTADAQLFRNHYEALYSLNAAAERSTARPTFITGATAAGLLGLNFADALTPTPEDLMRYGVDGGTPNNLTELAKTLITTAKAFSLGLTNMVSMSALNDDPHGAFNDMTNLTMRITTLGMILDGFYNDLKSYDDDSCPGQKISDNTVITIHGDTPKNPRRRSGWPDGTPGGSNWVYVLGNGHLKSGWFGGIDADNVNGWDPTTGENAGYDAGMQAEAATAAVLSAVAKGDGLRVKDFTRMDVAGVVRPVQL